MQLKLKTAKFQELVAKAIKGASNNKMIPVTSFLGIQLKSNNLYLNTTDGTNFLTVCAEKVDGQDFSVTVMADLFSKLVAKTTSEYITLDFDGTNFKFTGNGTYNLELPLDEEGSPVCFPDYTFDDSLPKTIIHTSTIKNIIQFNKPALATTLEFPAIINYYCKDVVVSADVFTICINKTKLWEDTARLISPVVMDLLALNTTENIEVQFDNNCVRFTTPELVVFGKLSDGVDDYPIDNAMAFENEQFPSSCKLPKSAVLNVLERLSLFISDFENNGVYLTFTADGLIMESNGSNAKELIKYAGSTSFKPYTCYASVPSLRSQIASHMGETIELHYGHDSAIKITDGNITQVIALMEDPRTSGADEYEEENISEESIDESVTE